MGWVYEVLEKRKGMGVGWVSGISLEFCEGDPPPLRSSELEAIPMSFEDVTDLRSAPEQNPNKPM